MTGNSLEQRWEELPPSVQQVLAGHVGPNWLPQKFCNFMAVFFTRYFSIRAQEIHDFGYMIGGDAASRLVSDRTLERLMRADAHNLEEPQRRRARYVTDLFYIAVRMFGWLSFRWRARPMTQDEITAELEAKEEAQGQEKYLILKWIAVIPASIVLMTTLFVSVLILIFLPPYTHWRSRKNRLSETTSDSDKFDFPG